MDDRGASLDADGLARELAGSMWTRVDVVDRTESTNADAAAAARDGAPEGLVVSAEHQVAGRGRLGRRWQSPPRSGLAMSVALRPAIPPARWPWLPLLTGIAVVDTVVEAARLPAGLKWPNDVVVDGRKVAGILVERVETPTGSAAVVGVGINVSLRADELPVPEATSLLVAGAATTDRARLLVDLLRRLETRYRAWVDSGGDDELRSDYLARCHTVGQRVVVSLPDDRSRTGLAAGIDRHGRLEIEHDGGHEAVGAGDVVHLRAGS